MAQDTPALEEEHPRGRAAALLQRCLRLLPLSRWADLASLFAWFCCGTSFVVTKQSFTEASPFVFQTLRFAVGAVTVAAVYGEPGLRFRAHAKGAAIVGTLLTTGYLFQSAALRITSPSRTAFLTALCVPLTPLFEVFLTRVRPSMQTLLSAAIAAVGTYLLTGSDGSTWGRGDSLMIACAVVFAWHFCALQHYASEEAASKTIAVGQMAVGMLLTPLFCALDDPPFIHSGPQLYIGIFLTGVFATGLAFALLTWAQQHMSASRTAILCATEPLFASAAAFVLLGEGMGTLELVGGALIIVSILVVSADAPSLWGWLLRLGARGVEGVRMSDASAGAPAEEARQHVDAEEA